jgi:uncharacterized coiled-coil DUF342 family protein
MNNKNMNKTRVDDLIIEMIQPKIIEIETKFSKGEGLTQDDINTLMLKSQYNHINHLDDKLNEVTADVASLKGKFDLLEIKIEKNIEKALNRNMIILVTVMVAFMTLSKIIDKFF